MLTGLDDDTTNAHVLREWNMYNKLYEELIRWNGWNDYRIRNRHKLRNANT